MSSSEKATEYLRLLSAYLLLLKNVSTYSLDDAEQEAQLRNTALLMKHNTKIPSYALWYGQYIGAEKECLQWWINLFADLNIEYLEVDSLEWFWLRVQDIVKKAMKNKEEWNNNSRKRLENTIVMYDAFSLWRDMYWEGEL